MTCRLCFEEPDILLPIYNDKGDDSFGMAGSILSFLEVDVSNNEESNNICANCWANVDNFQKFYDMISAKQKHNNAMLDVDEAGLINMNIEFADQSTNEHVLPSDQGDPSDDADCNVKESYEILTPFSRNRFQWKKRAVVKLIKEFRKHPELWHIKNEGYRNKKLKNNILEAIGKLLGCTAEDITRKIGTLRAQFLSETSKSKNINYTTKWAHYKSLMFLNESNAETIDMNNLTDEEDEIENYNEDENAFEWDEKTVLKLISECKKWPMLWDKSYPDFHDRSAKYESLHEVSREIGCTANMAWEKFTNLKSGFYRDIRRMTKNPKFLTVWKYFKSLLFLKKNLKESDQLIVDKWVKDSNYNTMTTTDEDFSNSREDSTNIKFAWTKAKITHFICLCKAHPKIWNSSTHCDDEVENESLKSIADMLGCTSQEAHRKFIILRNYFRKEIEKMNDKADYNVICK